MKIKVHSTWIDEERQIAYSKTDEVELVNNKDRLKALQSLVGGYIELVVHNNKHYLVDEEGLLKGFPINLWALQELGLQLFGNVLELSEKLD